MPFCGGGSGSSVSFAGPEGARAVATQTPRDKDGARDGRTDARLAREDERDGFTYAYFASCRMRVAKPVSESEPDAKPSGVVTTLGAGPSVAANDDCVEAVN